MLLHGGAVHLTHSQNHGSFVQVAVLIRYPGLPVLCTERPNDAVLRHVDASRTDKAVKSQALFEDWNPLPGNLQLADVDPALAPRSHFGLPELHVRRPGKVGDVRLHLV